MHRSLTWGLVVGLWLVASNARADDVPRHLGLDTVSEATAHRAAERIACSSPIARKYLRRTLRNVDTRRWGMVTKTLQEDTVDLVADAVYLALQKDRHGDVLREMVPPPGRCEAHEEARKALAFADERPFETEVDRCTARPTSERRKDPSCSFAAALRAGLDGDVATSIAYIADVVAAATLDAIYTGKTLSEAQKDALFEHVAWQLREVLLTESNEETIDTDVFRAFANVDLDAVRGWRCKDGDLVKDLAEGVVDPQDAFCSATRADLATENVAVTITGPAGEDRTLNLTGVLHAVLASKGDLKADASAADKDARVAEAVLCAVPLSAKDQPFADCTSGTLKIGRPGAFRLAVTSPAAQGAARVTSTWTIAVAPGKDRVRVESPSRLSLSGLVDGTVDALHLRANVTTLVRDKLLGEDPSSEVLRDLATTALRVRRVARTLDDAVAGADPAFLLGPIEALPALVPRFGPASAAAAPAFRCDAPKAPIERIVCGLARRDEGSLRRVVIAAEDGRVRDLASRVASLVTPHDGTCSGSAGGRLLEAFAAHTAEARGSSGGEPGPLAFEQVRGAGEDLSRCSSREDADPVFELGIVPTAALRFSWNSAYVNAWGGDGFRIAPSLDVLSARLRLTPRSAGARVTAGLSLVDLLAPVVELAMRRGDLRYDRQEVLWLEFVRPRLDLSFGVPSISNHLSVVGGVALRTAAPYRGGFGKPMSTATYLAVGTPGGAAAESFASYAEYNLGLKYTF